MAKTLPPPPRDQITPVVETLCERSMIDLREFLAAEGLEAIAIDRECVAELVRRIGKPGLMGDVECDLTDGGRLRISLRFDVLPPKS